MRKFVCRDDGDRRRGGRRRRVFADRYEDKEERRRCLRCGRMRGRRRKRVEDGVWKRRGGEQVRCAGVSDGSRSRRTTTAEKRRADHEERTPPRSEKGAKRTKRSSFEFSRKSRQPRKGFSPTREKKTQRRRKRREQEEEEKKKKTRKRQRRGKRQTS